MNCTFVAFRSAGFAGTLLGLTLFATAQELPQRQAPRTGAPPATQQPVQRVTANRLNDQANSADHTIAQCLEIENSEEIAVARIAADKAQNKKVREFAEMLVKDHSDQLKQLAHFGAQSGQTAPAGDRLPDGQQQTSDRQGSKTPRQNGTQPQQVAHAGAFDFLAVKRQLADRCVANAQREWSEKKAIEAEQCFLGAQVVGHQKMIDAQEILRQYASAGLQSTLDKGIEAAQSHLKQAKELLQETLRGDSQTRTAETKRDDGRE